MSALPWIGRHTERHRAFHPLQRMFTLIAAQPKSRFVTCNSRQSHPWWLTCGWEPQSYRAEFHTSGEQHDCDDNTMQMVVAALTLLCCNLCTVAKADTETVKPHSVDELLSRYCASLDRMLDAYSFKIGDQQPFGHGVSSRTISKPKLVADRKYHCYSRDRGVACLSTNATS